MLYELPRAASISMSCYPKQFVYNRGSVCDSTDYGPGAIQKNQLHPSNPNHSV